MNETAGNITISTTVFSFSVILVIFSVGVAWGTMNMRVNNVEKKLEEKLNKELFMEFRQNIEGLLNGIRDDMYDLRTSIHTFVGQVSKEFKNAKRHEKEQV